MGERIQRKELCLNGLFFLGSIPFFPGFRSGYRSSEVDMPQMLIVSISLATQNWHQLVFVGVSWIFLVYLCKLLSNIFYVLFCFFTPFSPNVLKLQRATSMRRGIVPVSPPLPVLDGSQQLMLPLYEREDVLVFIERGGSTGQVKAPLSLSHPPWL